MRELALLLAPFGVRVFGLDAFPAVKEVEENGSTFAENALLKASFACAATGLVALADDSGLEVDALGGAPGVRSARYSEEAGQPATDARNLEKLLLALSGVPADRRTARFRCCMAACTPGGKELLAEGTWEGVLALSPAGRNGFGYDPVFFDPEKRRTAAEMSGEEKNRRSHRARAVAALLRQWPLFWTEWTTSLAGGR
jgi:XTP/dITP diphosphohydrolase